MNLATISKDIQAKKDSKRDADDDEADKEGHPGNRERNREGADSELEDYQEGDFADLMSTKQIQQSIKVFHDRLRELINPIDMNRLRLDSVHQIKVTAR